MGLTWVTSIVGEEAACEAFDERVIINSAVLFQLKVQQVKSSQKGCAESIIFSFPALHNIIRTNLKDKQQTVDPNGKPDQYTLQSQTGNT